ncbi:hypothetical protein C8R45DRAFT_1082027 [Mycena sanguinolenta]|nr:hypothetical protein C8R45DRAFT_1082027 [Mycena sanguinolenta]
MYQGSVAPEETTILNQTVNDRHLALTLCAKMAAPPPKPPAANQFFALARLHHDKTTNGLQASKCALPDFVNDEYAVVLLGRIHLDFNEVPLPATAAKSQSGRSQLPIDSTRLAARVFAPQLCGLLEIGSSAEQRVFPEWISPQTISPSFKPTAIKARLHGAFLDAPRAIRPPVLGPGALDFRVSGALLATAGFLIPFHTRPSLSAFNQHRPHPSPSTPPLPSQLALAVDCPEPNSIRSQGRQDVLTREHHENEARPVRYLFRGVRAERMGHICFVVFLDGAGPRWDAVGAVSLSESKDRIWTTRWNQGWNYGWKCFASRLRIFGP